MNPSDLEALAAFRFLLRKFLRFSKDLLQAEHLTPDQYQTLLAIRTAPKGGRLTIRELAEQLQVKHHSTVGLVDQLVARELVVRDSAVDDRRKVLLSLTEKGENLLARLAPLHQAELTRLRPDMVRSLNALTDSHI